MAFTWSYSKLKNFETCAKRHYHVDVKRDVKEAESAELVWGNRFHDAMAKAIGTDDNATRDRRDQIFHKPLPPEFKEWQHHVDKFRAIRDQGATVNTELALCVDQNFQPCPWFDQRGGPARAWYRCKVDVAVLRRGAGYAGDWKTGKPKDDDAQLMMTGLVMFQHYPELQRITTEFVWVNHPDAPESRVTIDRSDMAAIWNDIYPRVTTLFEAHMNQIFNPTPSGLCKSWCPVHMCEFHGKGRPR